MISPLASSSVRLFGRGGESVDEPGFELFSEREEDRVLGGVVEVHGPSRDVGSIGNRLDGGRVEPAIAPAAQESAGYVRGYVPAITCPVR